MFQYFPMNQFNLKTHSISTLFLEYDIIKNVLIYSTEFDCMVHVDHPKIIPRRPTLFDNGLETFKTIKI